MMTKGTLLFDVEWLRRKQITRSGSEIASAVRLSDSPSGYMLNLLPKEP
jgi:hypothetical protein